MATKTKAPTQAQMLAALQEQVAALAKLVLELAARIPQALATVMPPAVAIPADEYPFWARPAGPMPAWKLDRHGYIADCTDPDELRQRALWCVNWRGGITYFRPEDLDKVWAEVEQIKALTPESVKKHKGGLYRLLYPEVAIFLVLTGEIPLYAQGGNEIHPWDTYNGLTLDEVLASKGGNAGQGASGAQEGE